MCDCTSLVEAIKNGGQELERAIMDIMNGKDSCGIAKMVFYVYNRHCGKCSHTYSWEELLHETIMRLINSINKGNEPRKQDCRPFIFQIAKFVCWEWGRSEDKGEDPGGGSPSPPRPRPVSNPNFPIEDLAALRKLIPELDQATSSCLEEIGAKCRLLLNLRFFNDEPVSDPQELAERLKKAGYEVSPHVIPQEISNCKAKLRACLKKKLEGYYYDHF